MSDGGWNTIDSDAGVFTELTEKLNIKDVQFEDLYGIDEESLKSCAPLYGVIFLFKYGSLDQKYATDGNKAMDGEYDSEYLTKNIFFANQTIQNACATQAVLNVILNRSDIEIGENLSEFKSFVNGFDSVLIGESISNSELIRTAHNSFSPPSMMELPPSKNPNATESDVFHFVGYLRINDYIYELDGLKKYPIKHIGCNSEDEFYPKLEQILKKRISLYKDELRFSLIGITRNKLKMYQDQNNELMINAELNKRDIWKKENALRRHDYTGLILQLLRDYSKSLSDEEWRRELSKAKKTGQERALSRFSKTP